jgi:predicted transposase YbfD/YdcC
MAGVIDALAELPEPRQVSQCDYPLKEMLLVALCGVICGAQGWVEVAYWGNTKVQWLRQFLPFKNDIASHDTFGRLFAALDSKRFQACLIDWMADLCPLLAGQGLSIDGKSLRGSHNGDVPMAHIVSAWNVATGVTVGQLKTAAKSNEITAIPKLIESMDIGGAVVTIDAMGCQREIVAAVVDKDLSAIESQLKCWPGVRSVVMVESIRQIVNGRDKGEPTTEWRYYISSLDVAAPEFNQRIREHWAIENKCHWVLDVAFKEDACRVRCGHGAENLGILRRIALNLISQDKGTKRSKRLKLLGAAWDCDYLQTLLGLKAL